VRTELPNTRKAGIVTNHSITFTLLPVIRSTFYVDKSRYSLNCKTTLGVFAIDGTVYQWSSRDRNLRDRDLVKISRRELDRDFFKNSETETKTQDLKFETETRDFKICAFCRNFLKISSSLLTWIFSNFWHFSDMFWLFLTCKYNKHKIVELYKILINHFFCNIQRLETWNLRDRDETWTFKTETENRRNGSRDETKSWDSITAVNTTIQGCKIGFHLKILIWFEWAHWNNKKFLCPIQSWSGNFLKNCSPIKSRSGQNRLQSFTSPNQSGSVLTAEVEPDPVYRSRLRQDKLQRASRIASRVANLAVFPRILACFWGAAFFWRLAGFLLFGLV